MKKISSGHRGFSGGLRYLVKITQSGESKTILTLKKLNIMKIKLIALSLCLFTGVNLAKAQEASKNFTPSENKHEFRLSVSDGLTQSTVDVLGIGLADAITGTKRSDERASMVYGLGYRYALNRFKLGADLGFSQTSSKLMLAGETAPSIKEKELNFLVLPTAEFTYFRRGLVELYGSAAAGISLKRHSETGLTDAGKKAAQKTDLNTAFAYQVNPIALRVGNDRIGGFVEAGLGHKGFLTAGVSVKF